MTKKLIYKFAHFADAHLGIRPRGSRTRKLDIFDTYLKMIDEIIAHRVDAVFICGDFLHTKVVDFETIRTAEQGLENLINSYPSPEVYPVDGNHDHVPEYGWIEYFRNCFTGSPLTELIYDHYRLLHRDEGDINLYRLNWSNPQAVMVELDKLLPRINIADFNILLVHQAIEGHIFEDERKAYIPLKYLDKLKNYFSYVGLGHIHHSYVVDDFAFNPGSIEYLSTSDWDSPTGWFLVKIYDDFTFDYELIQTHKRPNFKVIINSNDLKQLDKKEIMGIIEEAHITPQAMVYVEFAGDKELSPRLIKEIELDVRALFNPTFLKIRNFTIPRQMALPTLAKPVDDVYVDVFGNQVDKAAAIEQAYKDAQAVIDILDE